MGCRVQSGLSRDCKHCGINAFKRQMAKFNLIVSPGIEGLHSSWITDYALGMQRLHQSNISEIVDKFIASGIGSVFNLTQPGEHPYCGHELLESSGFSYDPNVLMRNGINHFNYNWEDMTAPSMSMLLDIVQVALHEISRGSKIAVHCHAGYGRTGTIIACVIIAKEGFDHHAAIRLVREKRPGSIQKQSQEKIIKEFQSTWRDAKCEYPAPPNQEGSTSSTVQIAAPTTPKKGTSEDNESFGPGTPITAPSSPVPERKCGDSSDTHPSSSGVEPPMLLASPPKSINRSVHDARMFHTRDEILGYPENCLRFVSKGVIHCCAALTASAEQGEQQAKAVLASFGAVDQGQSTELILLRAKTRINSGDWAVLKEVEDRPDVMSLLVLDWLASRSDFLFERDTLVALCTYMGLRYDTSAAVSLSLLLRPSSSPKSGNGGEAVLAKRLFAAVVDTLQKPHLYLLDLLVRLLRALCVALKVEFAPSLPQHQHGLAFLRVVALLASSLAPSSSRAGGIADPVVPSRGLSTEALEDMEKVLFGDGDASPMSAVACVLLSLATAHGDVSVPTVLSPGKRRAIREMCEGAEEVARSA